MNAVEKIDRILPWVSSSIRNDLLDVRAELVQAKEDALRLAIAVIDHHRPQSLPDAPLYVGPSPVNPISQEDGE